MVFAVKWQNMEGDIREVLKKKLIVIQEKRIREEMVVMPKTDSLLMNSFSFCGKKQKYLELPFHQARIIFMLTCRMILTKDNFPGRCNGTLCNICRETDTDIHLFQCPGFVDLLQTVSPKVFFDVDANVEQLKDAADKMIKVNDRLKVVQESV